MKVLIPVVTLAENDPVFLEKAAKGAKEVHLVLVLDAKAGEGLPASAMMQGNSILRDMASHLRGRVKKVEEIVEWGDPFTKISHYAKLKEIRKIALRREDSQFMGEFCRKLEEEGFKVEQV